jgi:predicted transcriptional regulator
MKVIRKMRSFGYSKMQIAKICNISESTVSSILIDNIEVKRETKNKIIDGVTNLCDSLISALPRKETDNG